MNKRAKSMQGNQNARKDANKNAVIYVRCTPEQKSKAVAIAAEKKTKLADLILDLLDV